MPTELLFSYGTLQDSAVQLETFGRELEGYVDQLLNYKLDLVKINNAQVVALSGKTYHQIAVPNLGSSISGKVFKISAQELAYADKYEVAAYKRVMGEFQSGQAAWVYVQV